jgi:hypothetical protein
VALAYQESAQQLAGADEDPSIGTYGYLWLAMIRDRCGMHEGALESIRRARDSVREIDGDDSRRRAEADIDFAEGMVEQGTDPEPSLALLSSALDYARATGRHYRTAQILLARARAFRRNRQPERSESDLLDGLREFEGQRQLVSDETLRTLYFGKASDLFDELISLLLDRGEVASARDVAERPGSARSSTPSSGARMVCPLRRPLCVVRYATTSFSSSTRCWASSSFDGN